MASDFEELFATFAVPSLVEQFGERDGNGDFRPLKYWPPLNPSGEPFLWRGIAGPVRADVEFTVDGEVRRETKLWNIERTILDDAGITHPQRNARIEDADGTWQVDVNACIWGPSFVTLALVRAPRTAGNELRRAGV
jgi:hypothetical protein